MTGRLCTWRCTSRVLCMRVNAYVSVYTETDRKAIVDTEKLRLGDNLVRLRTVLNAC